MGLLLDRSLVSSPDVIREQFRFRRWTMLSMFLSAAATGSVALHLMMPFHGSTPKNLNIPRNVLGGLSLGIGMLVSGSCPGTVLAQVGAGSAATSLWSLGGGIAGAALFSVLASNPLTSSWVLFPAFNQGPLRLPASFVPVFVAALGSAVYGVRSLLTAPAEIEKEVAPLSSFDSDRPWNPVLSGMLIGALQIPSLLITGSPLGTSGAYVTAAGLLLSGIFGYHNGYLNQFSAFSATNNRPWLGLLFDFGLVAGGWISSHLRSSTVSALQSSGAATKASSKEEVAPISWSTAAKAFTGGMMIVFGARLADGCTSGMGLSTMALLGFGAFATVASMFAGGIGAAVMQSVL